MVHLEMMCIWAGTFYSERTNCDGAHGNAAFIIKM